MSESNQMQKYFESIANQTSKAYAASTAARKKGMDPEPRVDVPLAANMAERVAGLVSLAAPNLESAKLTERIRELESMYEQLDWRVGLKIAEEVAQGKFCKFRDNVEAMEVGIRVGFAYLTLGIVAAPLEGFIGLKIKQRKDGGNYLAIYYAGPIRGAGGTAAALSVILSDYVRIVMGLGKYDPTPEEISRYATEINDYHERVTNLQYKPSDEEVKFLAGSIAVEINGDPTEEIEVSNYKDLQRIETNRIRGGICLVLAEGIAQKSPKLWKRLSKWGKDFGLEWEFLNDFLEIQKKIKARSQAKSQSSTITPNYTFIADLVAGRPVLSHPMRNGGFRLRYGRTPISGFSAAGLHPATLSLFNNYIATGTQLKTERPGKAASVTPCDSIEGPIVKLKNGSVARLSETKGIKQILNEVEEILYLGDILFSYGDFSENGHKLVPAGYCEEWWQLDVESKGGKVPTEINFDTVLKLSKDYNTPMHPLYTYFWKSISIAEYAKLTEWFKRARMDYKEDELIKIIIPLMHNEEAKRILELLGVPHNVINNEFVVITGSDAQCIKCCLGESVGEDVLSTVSKAAGFKVMDKAGKGEDAQNGRLSAHTFPSGR